MIRKSLKDIKCYIFVCLICISSNIVASDFAQSFNEFVLGSNKPSNSSSSENSKARLPATSQSLTCMACHDGSRAGGVELKHADTAMQFTSHGSVNHPVGMNYRSYAYRDPVSYVSPEALDSRIILENGEVTCISCHALKRSSLPNQDKLIKTAVTKTEDFDDSICTSSNKLTTGTSMTQLCLSCHAM